MGPTRGNDPEALESYEGLIFTTARLVLRAGVEMDVEDIEQRLRIKAWRALERFDPQRSRSTVARYVFMCLADEVKDLKKRKRYGVLFIDTIAAVEPADRNVIDGFDARYLSCSHDDVYGRVDDDDLQLPNTLTDLEREIVTELYVDYRDPKQTEVAHRLGLDKRDMERHMRRIRAKLADWRPDVSSRLESRDRLAA